MAASFRKSEESEPFSPHPSPGVLVKTAWPLFTEPISHSSTGLTPLPPLKNKIKRDLSSSCHSSSLLHQQPQLSWAGSYTPGRDCQVSLAGGPKAHLLGLCPPCSDPPSSPLLLPHCQPRNILNGFNLKLQKQSLPTFLKFTVPALYPHLSFIHAFIKQVVQFVTSLLKIFYPFKLNYGVLLSE